mgnify:CR=1 FL=1
MNQENGPPQDSPPAKENTEPEAPKKEAASPTPDAKQGAEKKAAPAAEKPKPKPRPKKPSYEDLEEDTLLDSLKEQFPQGIVSGQVFLEQPIYTVTLDRLYDVMLYLRDHSELAFDYLVDVTALDYLGDEERFVLVYQLYSYQSSRLIRVKARLPEDQTAPSVTSIWRTANWLEREVYDMFGIEFSGHPKLRRILLPDDWRGYPLRKDYDIKLQDQTWIKKHLRMRKLPD